MAWTLFKRKAPPFAERRDCGQMTAEAEEVKELAGFA
jgi:hypothetical protein